MKAAIVGVLSVLGVLSLAVVGVALVPQASDAAWRLTGVRVGVGTRESRMGLTAEALQGPGAPEVASASPPMHQAPPSAPARDVANTLPAPGAPRAQEARADDGQLRIVSAPWVGEATKVILPTGTLRALPTDITLPVGAHALVFSAPRYGHVRCEVRVRPSSRITLTYAGRHCEAEWKD